MLVIEVFLLYDSSIVPPVTDQNITHQSGSTIFFPFRGPKIGAHHMVLRARRHQRKQRKLNNMLSLMVLFDQVYHCSHFDLGYGLDIFEA